MTILALIATTIGIGALACFFVWAWLQPRNFPENHEHVSGDFR